MTTNATKRPRTRGPSSKVSVERALMERVRALLVTIEEKGGAEGSAASRLIGALDACGLGLLRSAAEPKPAPHGFGEGP